MTVMFNPVDFVHQLEREGIARGAAEAIAAGIEQGRSDLATKADLEPLATKADLLAIKGDLLASQGSLELKLSQALHRQTIQFGVMLSAVAGLAVAAMGVITAIG